MTCAPPLLPRCWACGDTPGPHLVETESLIQPRSERDGGPFRWFHCSICGVRNGVLAARQMGWLLYPLQGRAALLPIDWLLSKKERAVLRRARTWWKKHAAHVGLFVDGAKARERARKRAQERVPPRQSGRRAVEPKPAPRTDAGPWEVLGMTPGGSADDVRRAYRRAVKNCHPDRFAHLEPHVQQLATKQMMKLRDAYEALLRELGATT